MARPHKEISYTVKGHWPFPTDMLRHDASQPATELDSFQIDALSQEYAPDRSVFQDVEINLTGPCKPNTARWESFGWAVPTDTDHAMYKRWAQERRDNDALYASALAKLTPAERQIVAERSGYRA